MPNPGDPSRPLHSPEIRDDFDLLETMIRASERQDKLWRPTSYWQNYCHRIRDELKRSGLAKVRTNQAILKGFATGGTSNPALPPARWKRAIWVGLEKAPIVSRIIGEYRRLLRAEHVHHIRCRTGLAQLLIERTAQDFPNLAPPIGLANGGAEDVFAWRSSSVTADWVPYLVRAAAFYRAARPANISTYIEIGPGLGLSTLAHIALNPNLRVIVNVDIPPVLYVSTQFLKSVEGLRVIDFAEAGEGAIQLAQNPDGPLVYQLAPWQLKNVREQVDAFFNAYSFQEMERENCANYARVIKPLVRHHVCLMSSVGGHRRGAGGQKEPIPLDHLAALFAPEFSQKSILDHPDLPLINDPQETALLTRARA